MKVEGFNLSRNHLQGTVPTELGNLKAANIIDLSSNDFSGEIPDSVGYLQSLLALDMSQNKFDGPIPNSLSNLVVIEFLDLHSNRLSGSIPASLGSLRDLTYLDLSFNMLRGRNPTYRSVQKYFLPILDWESKPMWSSYLKLSNMPISSIWKKKTTKSVVSSSQDNHPHRCNSSACADIDSCMDKIFTKEASRQSDCIGQYPNWISDDYLSRTSTSNRKFQ